MVYPRLSVCLSVSVTDTSAIPKTDPFRYFLLPVCVCVFSLLTRVMYFRIYFTSLQMCSSLNVSLYFT